MSEAIHRFVYGPGSNPGPQPYQNLNHLQNPFQVTAIVDTVSGDSQYGIEITGDDTGDFPGNMRWFPLPSALPGQTNSGAYSITTPVTAIRLNLTSITGEVRFTVIQSPGSL